MHPRHCHNVGHSRQRQLVALGIRQAGFLPQKKGLSKPSHIRRKQPLQPLPQSPPQPRRNIPKPASATGHRRLAPGIGQKEDAAAPVVGGLLAAPMGGRAEPGRHLHLVPRLQRLLLL